MLIITIGFLICLQLTYWYPDSIQLWSVCEGMIILFVLIRKFIRSMLDYCPKCHKYFALEEVYREHIRNEYTTTTTYRTDRVSEKKTTHQKVYHVIKECKLCHKYRKTIIEYDDK